jgi:type I restriction enzyme S subunit
MGEDGSVINENKKPILNWATGKIWVNNHAHVLSATPKAILRFVYHYLHTVDVSPIVRGMPPKINQKNLRKISIPIPPLEEQKRIVSILNRFDALVNDLTSGIPAEIEARRKQYEYYRDKLLTFKELAS